MVIVELFQDRYHRRSAALMAVTICAAIFLGGCAAPAPATPDPASPGPASPDAASPGPTTPTALEPVSLRLDFRTTGSHAGSFLALERGYFAEAGLNVSILDGQGSLSTTQVVGSGLDTFGWADASVVALNVTEGVPVTMVADVLQLPPTLVLSRADNPVDTPAALEGRSVGVVFGGSAQQQLSAFIAVNSLDPSTIETVNMVGTAQPAAFLTEQVDVLVTSLGSAIATTREAQAQGFDTHILWFADHGVNVLAHGYIVNDEMIVDRPDTIESFLGAAIRGWEEAADDPQAAVDAIVANRPDANPETMRAQLDLFLDQFHTPNTADCPIGWQSSDDWQAMLDFLTEYSEMGDTLTLDSYFTNDFLPESC